MSARSFDSRSFALSPLSVFDPTPRRSERAAALWYGGVAVGVLAGAALSTFLWRRRISAVVPDVSPLERAEELIALCERKLETIEQSVADLKDLKSDLQAAPTRDAANDGNVASPRAASSE
jgi:hypothetical protein